MIYYIHYFFAHLTFILYSFSECHDNFIQGIFNYNETNDIDYINETIDEIALLADYVPLKCTEKQQQEILDNFKFLFLFL